MSHAKDHTNSDEGTQIRQTEISCFRRGGKSRNFNIDRSVIQVKDFVVRARLDNCCSAHLVLLAVFLGTKGFVHSSKLVMGLEKPSVLSLSPQLFLLGIRELSFVTQRYRLDPCGMIAIEIGTLSLLTCL